MSEPTNREGALGCLFIIVIVVVAGFAFYWFDGSSETPELVSSQPQAIDSNRSLHATPTPKYTTATAESRKAALAYVKDLDTTIAWSKRQLGNEPVHAAKISRLFSAKRKHGAAMFGDNMLSGSDIWYCGALGMFASDLWFFGLWSHSQGDASTDDLRSFEDSYMTYRSRCLQVINAKSA